MFPYKIAEVQHLTEDDNAKRVDCAQWCKDKMSKNSSFLNRIFFSNECVFHVPGIANTQNTRIWELKTHEKYSSTNPTVKNWEYGVQFIRKAC